MDPNAGGAIMGGLFGLGIILVMLILTVIVWWKIFTKAGFHGALSLIMLVPLVNLILLLYFAFAEWPIQKQMRGGPIS